MSVPAARSTSAPAAWAAIAIILGAALLYFATLSPGHRWGDDFAMYILHARNLAEGRAYTDTGYIFNPSEPHLGPTAYPPAVPVLLAPVYKTFGLNAGAMKATLVAVFLFGLWLMYLFFRYYLTPAWAAAALAAVAFNPSFWTARDDIGSDLMFIAPLFAVLLLIERSYHHAPTLRSALLLALLIYVAVTARTVAVVLLPAFIGADLLRLRTIRRPTLITVGVAVAVLAAHSLFLAQSQNSVSLFRFDPGWWVSNAFCYLREMRGFLRSGALRPLSFVLYGFATLLVLLGLWTKRRQPGILEAFAVIYGALILAYSVCVYRYLFPLVPLYLMLVMLGLSALYQRFSSLPGRAAAALFGVMLATAYSAEIARLGMRPIEEGIGDARFQELCSYIRDHTPPDAVVMARKPRVLTLLSGRAATVYPETGIADWVRTARVGFIAVGHVDHEDFASDRTVLDPYVKADPRVSQVYDNGRYALYRVNP